MNTEKKMDSTTYLELKYKAFDQVVGEIKEKKDAGLDPCDSGLLWRLTTDAKTELNKAVANIMIAVLEDPDIARQYPAVRTWLMLSVRDTQESLTCEALHAEQALDEDFKNL
ncbi:MAG TPA: hypothetical protein DCL09_01340 [Sutterella sp.]|nr:hypothetical protein [Sutterella sp.]